MKFSFIDLFSGCGGLSLGLEQAGFVPVYVNELNSDALNTYLENRKQFSYLKEEEFHSKFLLPLHHRC
jgi:DNA (cytosine-5)-methyltransferase 1